MINVTEKSPVKCQDTERPVKTSVFGVHRAWKNNQIENKLQVWQTSFWYENMNDVNFKEREPHTFNWFACDTFERVQTENMYIRSPFIQLRLCGVISGKTHKMKWHATKWWLNAIQKYMLEDITKF